MTDCHRVKVAPTVCYLDFRVKKKARDVRESFGEWYTVRGENLIIDFDREGRVLGIELLGSDECPKPCEEVTK